MAGTSELTEHLLQSSPDALLVVDEAGAICFANETVTELFGYTPESLIGKPLETLVPKRLRERHAGHVAGYGKNPYNREMGARIRELYALRADGTEFPANIRLAPLRVDEKLYVAAAIRDATERMRASEELIAAREEADRANRAKSRFLATASHDLRQPIQTIQLLNASLLKIAPDAQMRELLGLQRTAIEGMTRLLNALLDISRLESGGIEPVMRHVSLADVCDELRAEFSSLAASHALDLRIAETTLAISTDRTLFYQLLQNLVANAIKYTERGFVRVAIERSEASVAIVVEDSGIGIPSDKLDRIFDEYYQVDTHGAKRIGVGLGLAIVKEVAGLLGLNVTISSTMGVGTRARVDIPKRLLVPDIRARETRTEVARHTETPKASRLILVEDNDAVRRATETFLRVEGFETLSAPSVAEAEKVLRDLKTSDILIADFHLDTRQTGLDLLVAQRQRLGFDVPGIIMSGDLATVKRRIERPIDRCVFLSKPVDVDALVQAIHQLSADLPLSPKLP